jgi:TusA-related sulfurtransferase
MEFLEKLNSVAKQGDAIEVLTCDENTLQEDSGWLKSIHYTLHRVHREHGYYRMIIKPNLQPA